jgi:hypothetical protein
MAVSPSSSGPRGRRSGGLGLPVTDLRPTVGDTDAMGFAAARRRAWAGCCMRRTSICPSITLALRGMA